jgi:hypothetical protein
VLSDVLCWRYSKLIFDECSAQIYYTDLDTLVGSSGAGVLTQAGYLLAVHTDGDCAEDGTGSNRGWSSPIGDSAPRCGGGAATAPISLAFRRAASGDHNGFMLTGGTSSGFGR